MCCDSFYTLGKGVASALDRYGKDFSPTKLSMFFVPLTWYYVTWNAFCRIANNKAPRTYDCDDIIVELESLIA